MHHYHQSPVSQHHQDLFPLCSWAVNPAPSPEDNLCTTGISLRDSGEDELVQSAALTNANGRLQICSSRFRGWRTIIWSRQSCSEQDTIRRVPKQLEMASLSPGGVQMDYCLQRTKPILDKQIMGFTIICT